MKTVQQFLTNHLPAVLGILIVIVVALIAVESVTYEVRISQAQQDLVSCRQQVVDQAVERAADAAERGIDLSVEAGQ